MSKIVATSNFVWIQRDEIKKELGGLLLPSEGQKKPNEGKIISVGKNVLDKNIKINLRALYPQGVGMEIEYEGITYIVVEGERIIAVI